MKETELTGSNRHYNSEYAKSYLERTLQAPYTINKSKLLASMASKFGARKVIDLGSNVHGSVKTEGSLRLQMNQRGIDYIGVDISPKYFDKQLIKEQNISEEKIYSQIDGIVGDILQLPVESDSMEMVVCSDVLEHVSDPSRALKEIFRILKTEGITLIVLPSLYKLDIANFSYIDKKRKSSHLKKITIDNWLKMCEENGLLIDEKNSMSIGVFSGLSYLAWIDDKFVPERPELSNAEIYSSKSILHKDTKGILSKYDESIDSKIHSLGIDSTLIEELKRGDIKKVFQILKDVTHTIISNQTEREVLDNFFNEAISIQYDPKRVLELQNIFLNAKFPKFLLGNSVLLVLKKKN